MKDRDPSVLALLFAVVAVGLLAVAFLAPWWTYDTSTGRKTAPGGPQDPDDTRVERHSYDAGPFQERGDTRPADQGTGDLAILLIGVAWAVAAAGMLTGLAGEALRFVVHVPRALSLWAIGLACLALVAGLAVAWLMPAQAMEQQGVTGTFTDVLLEDGYIRTSLHLGWIAAAIAIPVALGSFAFRYQAGSHDPAAIEVYSKRKAA